VIFFFLSVFAIRGVSTFHHAQAPLSQNPFLFCHPSLFFISVHLVVFWVFCPGHRASYDTRACYILCEWFFPCPWGVSLFDREVLSFFLVCLFFLFAFVRWSCFLLFSPRRGCLFLVFLLFLRFFTFVLFLLCGFWWLSCYLLGLVGWRVFAAQPSINGGWFFPGGVLLILCSTTTNKKHRSVSRSYNPLL